jgi:hypothetical protein
MIAAAKSYLNHTCPFTSATREGVFLFRHDASSLRAFAMLALLHVFSGALVFALAQPSLHRAAPIADQRTKKLEWRSVVSAARNLKPLRADAEPFGDRRGV